MQEPLYLGLDLSTQQLKAIVVNSNLKAVQNVTFDFDADSSGFEIEKGVITDLAEHEVYAPVALWLQALDGVLQKLKGTGLDLARVRGISAAGQQHGSVYWNADAEKILATLDSSRTLQDQVQNAFSHPYSPNWQDASTHAQCELFDSALGGPAALSQVTGSKAHHVCFHASCEKRLMTELGMSSVSLGPRFLDCSKGTLKHTRGRPGFLWSRHL
jgi:xylulokinase